MNKTQTDEYAWLSDLSGHREEITRVLEDENRRVEDYLAGEQELGKTLESEIGTRYKKADREKDWLVGGVKYRQVSSGKFLKLERFDTTSSNWVTVIDAAARAQANATGFYQMRTPVISPDNRYALLLEDRTGAETSEMTVWDIAAARETDKPAAQVVGDPVWSPDSQRIYYVTGDKNHPTSQLKKYTLADVGAGSATSDELVFDGTKQAEELAIEASSSGDYLILNVTNANGTEQRLLDPSKAAATVFTPQGLQASADNLLDHADDGFYLRSNQDGRYALYFSKEATGPWKKIHTPADKSEFESFLVLRDWVVVKERDNGLSAIRYWRKSSPDKVRTIPFPDHNYMVWMRAGSHDDVLALGYTSPTVPQSRIAYHLGRQEWLNTWPTEREDYQTEHFSVPARDGVKVPVTLVYRKFSGKPAQAPLLITGYGAYGVSLAPVYGTSYKSLLDRGFVYAIAHVRGGGELGSAWHEQGRGRNKKNGINDFVDVTRYLQKRFHAQGRTYAMGESAGALLVAASMIQEPELFSAVVLHVPFLDVAGAMTKETTLTGEQERAEWGRANNAEDLDYIHSYSPYQTLKAVCYPPVLTIAAFNDARTPYWESLKFMKKLGDVNCNKDKAFLFTEMTAGHAGAAGRVSRNVLSYRYILKQDQLNRDKDRQKSGQ